MPTSGVPQDLDDQTLRSLARSFYVVKMARYAALLVASLGIGALAASQDAPSWVAWTLVALAVAFVVAMTLTRRRYLKAQRRPAPGSGSAQVTCE